MKLIHYSTLSTSVCLKFSVINPNTRAKTKIKAYAASVTPKVLRYKALGLGARFLGLLRDRRHGLKLLKEQHLGLSPDAQRPVYFTGKAKNTPFSPLKQ